MRESEMCARVNACRYAHTRVPANHKHEDVLIVASTMLWVSDIVLVRFLISGIERERRRELFSRKNCATHRREQNQRDPVTNPVYE